MSDESTLLDAGCFFFIFAEAQMQNSFPVNTLKIFAEKNYGLVHFTLDIPQKKFIITYEQLLIYSLIVKRKAPGAEKENT